MRAKIFKSLILVSILASSSSATKIGNMFDVKAEENKITIDSNKMTYYFVNIVSPDGKTKSAPILIEGPANKLKVNPGDVNVKWQWPLPGFSYKTPEHFIEFSSKKNTIDAPFQFYKGWKNSTLQFQGATFKDIHISSSKNGYQWAALFLLNIAQIGQYAADLASMKAPKELKDKKKIERLLEIAERVENYQDLVKEISFYMTITNGVVDILNSVIVNFDKEGLSATNELREKLAYWRYVKTLIDKMSGTIKGIKIDDKALKAMQSGALGEMLKDDYIKSVAKQNEANGETYDGLIKALAKSGKSIKDDKTKYGKVFDAILSGIQSSLVSYQKNLLGKKPKPGNTAALEMYNSKLKRMRIAKLAIAMYSVMNKAITSDNFHKDGSFVLKFLKEAGSELWGLLTDAYVNDPMKFINKYSDSFSDAVYGKVKKGVAKIARGVQIGHVVGNKLIPFLADFLLEDSLASIDIVDGKESMYGPMENRVKVYALHYNNDHTFDRRLIYDGKQLQNGKSYPIYADSLEKMHEMYAEMYLKRKHLFDDPERSPWEIGSYFPPQELYNIIVMDKDGNTFQKGVCAKKPPSSFVTLAQTTFVEFSGDKHDGLRHCGDDAGFSYPWIVGAPQYDFVSSIDVEKYPQLKLLSTEGDQPVYATGIFPFYTGYESGNQPDDSTAVAYSGDNDLTLLLSGYGMNVQKISMPLYYAHSIDISFVSEHRSNKDIIKLNSFTLPNNNEATKYVWNFSDIFGDFETTSPQIERAVPAKDYNVSVQIFTKQGNILYRSAHIYTPLKPVITIPDDAPQGYNLSDLKVGDTLRLDSAESTGGDEQHLWIITDKSTDEDIDKTKADQLNYTFEDAGSYTVKLCLFNAADEFECAKEDIIVRTADKPVVKLELLNADTCKTIKHCELKLGILSEHGGDGGSIDWGDGTTNSTADITSESGDRDYHYWTFTHDYAQDGTYWVNGTTQDGTDSVSLDVVVGGAPVTTTRLKKTGQTKSYDEAGNEVARCTVKDDGCYQTGVTPSYTRANDVVTDNVTGLQWQDNEEAKTITKPWLTQENYDKCRGQNGQTQDTSKCTDTSGDTAATYCANLSLDGGGWRLPTVQEMQGIVVDGAYNPSIDTTAFVNCTSSRYWSSTTYAYDTDRVFVVYFQYGNTNYLGKYFGDVYVRCVR